MSQAGVWPELCRRPNGSWRKRPEDQSQSTDVRKQGQTEGHCTAGSQDREAPKLKGTVSVTTKEEADLCPPESLMREYICADTRITDCATPET